MNKTIIWGHRGAGFIGIQNCLSSFQKAADMGVDGLKSEAKLSKEGEVFLSFNRNLKKYGADTPLQELSVDEIKKFKFENGESIPTLREVFEALEGYNLKYNFDITRSVEGIRIIETAKDYGLIDRIELAKPSTYPGSLSNLFTAIRNFDKRVTFINSVSLKYSLIDNKSLDLDEMKRLNIEGVNVNYHFVNADLFKKIKDLGFKFYVWGILFKRSIIKFLKMKYHNNYIDGIMSNQPDRLIKLRKEFQN